MVHCREEPSALIVSRQTVPVVVAQNVQMVEHVLLEQMSLVNQQDGMDSFST